MTTTSPLHSMARDELECLLNDEDERFARALTVWLRPNTYRCIVRERATEVYWALEMLVADGLPTGRWCLIACTDITRVWNDHGRWLPVVAT